jgi:hypothetical protein
MGDAPERIWAVVETAWGAICGGSWTDTIRQSPDGVEYVRADLASPLAAVAMRDAAAELCWTAKDEFDFCYWGGDANAHAVRVNLTGKQRAIRALPLPDHAALVRAALALPEVARLVEAADALNREAFQNMIGGKGHLIDDVSHALAALPKGAEHEC